MRLQAQTSYSPGKEQRQPNYYPTTIEVKPSQSRLSLEDRDERLSLDDSFGFDDNTNTKSDALFERLYHELDEEEDGTTLQSSIDLNSYSPKDIVGQGKLVNPPAPITASNPISTSKEDKTVDMKYLHVISPTVAMDRRRSSKPQSNS